MASATYDEPHAMSQSKNAADSGWIGSALESYELFIYATAASLIPPSPSSHHSLPMALATLLGRLAPLFLGTGATRMAERPC